LVEIPGRAVIGSIKFEYDVEAAARPTLRDAGDLGSERSGDCSDILMLPTNQHYPIRSRYSCREIDFLSFPETQIDLEPELRCKRS
jgi:hypothetical protein